MTWISVEDKLPENNDDVLLLYDGQYRIGYFCDLGDECENYWYVNNMEIDSRYSGITHWMPLPKKPLV